VSQNNREEELKHPKKRSSWLIAGAALTSSTALLLATATPASAKLISLTDCTVTQPYGTTSFGSAGQYEQLACTATGALDIHDPLNAIIQDIDLAPRDAKGLVEYSMAVTILKPVDLGNSNQTLIYDVVNRGNRELPAFFNTGTTAANPGGDGFMQSQGYIMVASGWQGDVLAGNNRLTMQVPIATNRDGSTITGRVRTEYSLTGGATSTQNLGSGPYTNGTTASYETVSLDNAGDTLTERVHQNDPRVPIPNTQWAFADCTTTPFPGTPSTTEICLNGGFDTNHIYELIYTGKNPTVLGLGFAATRDLVSFLHTSKSPANPLVGAVKYTMIHGISQSGRFVRTFLDLGFNEDENFRKVFDAANPHIAASRVPLNVRFGAPGRAAGTQHQEDQFPGPDAPMTWNDHKDPITGIDAGILDRCKETETCPKIIQTVSGTEYWQSAMTDDTLDPRTGLDLKIPQNVRIFYLSSTHHTGATPGATLATDTKSYCQNFLNINPYVYNIRALITDLREWIVDGTLPPSSRYPTVADRTLAPAADIGFPNIPGVNFTALFNPRFNFNRGPRFDKPDMSGQLMEPPIQGAQYLVLEPVVDTDGNDIGGDHSVTLDAPLGTYTGWNYRAAGFSEGDLCDLSGSFFPFADTKAARKASGDPRPSLQERYGTHKGYVRAVTQAATNLVQDRLILPADATTIIAAANASDVLQ